MIDPNYTPSLGSTCLGLLIFGLFIFVLVTGVAFGKDMLDQNRDRGRVTEALELAKIGGMSQRQFRDFVARLMTGQGYSVRTASEDGLDAAMTLLATKDDRRQAVLAVRYSKAIAAPTVAEALAKQAALGCDGAMIVTNGTFVKAARNLAAANGCELIDQTTLAGWIEEGVLGMSNQGPLNAPRQPAP